MERVIFLEVLARHGVVHRVRADRLPLTIGRGYDNDLILDDEHADARHAQLNAREDGALVVEDLGSVNGTWLEHRGTTPLRGAAADVVAGQVIRIGRSRLRLAASDQVLPPARPEPAVAAGPLTRALTSRRGLILLPLIGAAAMVLQGWLADSQDDGASLASLAVGVVAILGAWAGGWALAGRLAIQQARFAAHHSLAWGFLLVMTLSGIVFGWLDFFTESEVLEAISMLIVAVLFVALIERHLSLASLMGPRRRTIAATFATATLILLGVLLGKAGSEFSGNEIVIGAVMKPVPAGLVSARSVDQLIEMTNELRKEVDESREE